MKVAFDEQAFNDEPSSSTDFISMMNPISDVSVSDFIVDSDVDSTPRLW